MKEKDFLEELIEKELAEEGTEPAAEKPKAKKKKAAEPEEAPEQDTNNEHALNSLLEKIETLQQQGAEIWKTGFPALDELIGGGFMEDQLIFLGALSALGKTTFALQLATQVAENGRDVYIFSLEMRRDELNAKIISMYTEKLSSEREKEYRVTTRDILLGNVDYTGFEARAKGALTAKGKLFKKALEHAQEIANKINIYVGSGDVSVDRIREVTERHIKRTGHKPLLIVDYLQIMKPSEKAIFSDKRLLTDYDVTSLKCIARDFRIPVLAISAFNRSNYLEPVSMGSFRESSGIEYSSDILLALQYSGMDYTKKRFKGDTGRSMIHYESEKDHKSRIRLLLERIDKKRKDGQGGIDVELKILKCRLAPPDTISFDFFPAYNCYHSLDKYRPHDDSYFAYSDVDNSDTGANGTRVAAGEKMI